MDNPKDECFICFETNNTITLHEIKYLYWSRCKCIATVHEKCFYLWFIEKPQCPICRKDYFEKIGLYKNIPYFLWKRWWYSCFIVFGIIHILYTINLLHNHLIHDSI
jgi:hypothetical protein